MLDTSALLAVLQREPGEDLVRSSIRRAAISVVNYSEVVDVLSRKGNDEAATRLLLSTIAIPLHAPDSEIGFDAGRLSLVTEVAGLSLGDRFCLALARRLGAPVLTADRAWERVADVVGVEVRLIR